QKADRIKEIDVKLTDPAIWNKPQESARLQKEKKILNSFLQVDNKLGFAVEELETYFQLIDEDPELLGELEEKMSRFQEYVEETEVKHYLNGESDASNALLSIHPGAGGTESQDWAEILLRMYLRFGERLGFKAEITDILPGEEAGIKSVTVRYEGEFAFGYLKEEIGVHRLVRISPFDANKRRHTSFAAVFVIPEVDDSITIDIDLAKDLRIDTYRSSGKGGQHVNRTDSAVRIVHLPTNTVVQCQSERSQHQNKDRAMKMLRSRLYDLELKHQQQAKDKIEDTKGGIAWGNQIRSYVMQPYQSIKDHRTGLERGDVQHVLDGDIIGFIKESLKLPR
ncbi:MAG TPA: peptide chain release factor 2, partial [Acidobacteriota bacterium]